MKTIIALATILVSWAALVTVLAGPAAVAAVAPAGAAAAGRRPVAFDCDGWRRGLVRMREFDVSCDANVIVTTKGWKYWTGTSARSRPGKLWVNTCQPNCAAGNYRSYPAAVMFYRVRWHHGVRYFSRMRLWYRHGRLRSYVYHWGKYPGASQPLWLGGP